MLPESQIMNLPVLERERLALQEPVKFTELFEADVHNLMTAVPDKAREQMEAHLDYRRVPNCGPRTYPHDPCRERG